MTGAESDDTNVAKKIFRMKIHPEPLGSIKDPGLLGGGNEPPPLPAGDDALTTAQRASEPLLGSKLRNDDIGLGHRGKLSRIAIMSSALDSWTCNINGGQSPSMGLAKRIAEARNARGISQTKLAELMHAGQSTVASWEKDKNEPALAEISRLAKVLGRTPEWLAFGLSPDVGADMAMLPEYDVRALSGAPGLLEVHEEGAGEAILRRYAVPRAEFRAAFGANPDLVAVFEVIGDSMLGTLNPGEKVFVNMGDRTPSPPGIFVVWDGLGLVLKRVEFVAHSDPPRVRIISDNNRYDPYERNLEEAYIQARVIGSWQRR